MSLLAPLGLLAGLLALPLIALYILKIRRTKVVVPSLLLWQELAQQERLAKPFERFKRNILLWLQLLVLALLALALARPTLPFGLGVGEATVLVVDTTASMGSTDERPHRLGKAIAEAERLVDALPTGAEISVVIAGPRTEVLVPFTQDIARVRRALRGLEVTHAEGSLREGVQLALSLALARSEAAVHIFSDGGGASLSDLSPGSTPVRYHRVGTREGNAGIIALDLRASPSSELARQVFVTAQRFGPAVEGTVSLYLEDRLLGLRNATLGDQPVSLVFELPAGVSGVIRAELQADDDNLALDNLAWAVVEPVRRRRVLAVGLDGFSLRALSSDSRVALTVRSASEVTEPVLRAADAVFLGRPIDLDLEGVNVAYLGPDTGGPAVFGEPMARPEVLSWRRTHPVLRLLALETVQIAEIYPVQDSGGLEPLVSTTAGPLVLGDERGGARVVQLAASPLRTDLPLRVAWPVMLLNAVGWLTEGRSGIDQGHVIQAGRPWSLRTDATADQVSVLGPNGEPRSFVLEDRRLRVQDTLTQGIYRARIGAQRLSFAANLSSPVESAIAPRPRLDLGAGPEGEQERQASLAGGQEIWRWLLIGALLVLIAEGAVWARRGRL